MNQMKRINIADKKLKKINCSQKKLKIFLIKNRFKPIKKKKSLKVQIYKMRLVIKN